MRQGVKEKSNNPLKELPSYTTIRFQKAALVPCRRIHRGQEEDGCFPAKVQLPLKKLKREKKNH